MGASPDAIAAIWGVGVDSSASSRTSNRRDNGQASFYASLLKQRTRAEDRTIRCARSQMTYVNRVAREFFNRIYPMLLKNSFVASSQSAAVCTLMQGLKSRWPCSGHLKLGFFALVQKSYQAFHVLNRCG